MSAELAAHLQRRGITDERVLAAMAKLDRRRFLPPGQHHNAELDAALPIGHDQTISQPYVVAFMTEALSLRPEDRVLEIGTGSGYQAAVLALLVAEVYSIEIVEPLAELASARLHGELGFTHVHLRRGDGHRGWPEAAPFDGIILTAAPERIPEALVSQLVVGGRLIAPVGAQSSDQELILVRRVTSTEVEVNKILGVRFVPMTHEDHAH